MHVQRFASVLHTLSLARTYRSNGKQHRSQIRRSHAYHPNLSAFGVTVPVGRRLFNECFSLVHDKGCCDALCTCNARAICESSDFGKF